MVTVKILEEHGLSLHTSSPQTAAKQLEDSLNSLSGEFGSPVGIVTRSIGRSTYHLAIFSSEGEAVEAKVAPVAVDADAEPKRAKRASSKAA